jgi:futalosine hydrolase
VRALLVVTAVAGERDALGLDALGVDAVAVGVGVAAAAAGTARLLASGDYRAVVSVGIGGGFAGRVGPGGTALATESIAADLGADSPDGFLPLSELGFGADRYPADGTLFEALRSVLPSAVTGPVLTVSTVTGTASGTAEMRRRYPDAVAEAMEGFGVATAAAGAGVPFAEIRTVSNVVGPRDRGAWRIGAALAALADVGRALGTLDR